MKKIQDIYKSLGEYGCLLLCYLHELLKFFWSDKRVVRDTNENGNTIVPYKYGSAEHFVVVNERKEIVFNSLENSTCVRLGEPVWEKARYLA